LLRFYILATSSRVKINKATSLYDEDILNIPFPESVDEMKLSAAEQIVLNESMVSIDPALTDFGKFNMVERQLKPFSEIFCKTLNSIYHANGKSFQLFKILDAGNYYALHFDYTANLSSAETETISDLEQYIHNIIPTQKNNSESTFIQRIIKIYGQDCIILAKPKQIRYWQLSIALRDADESFADYVKARYYAKG